MSRDQLQLKERESNKGMVAPDVDVDAEHRPEVSRRASNAGLRREAVQMRGGDATKDPSAVHDAAAAGVAGSGSKLPHFDRIQQSFGRHDISHVQAHVGGEAAAASQSIGAEAYASGNSVAFAQSPDLHTAAHEAAHVVQQSQGVNLYGGVGQAGDAHERNADAVADRVVKGESAEDLLGAPAAGPAKAEGQAVQRKETKEQADPKHAHETSDIRSMNAIASSLTLLAKHLHEGGQEIRGLIASEPAEGSGYTVAAQEIQRIFDSIYAEVRQASDMIGAAKLDKWMAQQLSTAVKQVMGARLRFAIWMPKANDFLRSKAKEEPRDEKLIDAAIAALPAKIGYGDTVLEADVKNPDETEGKLQSGAISEHIDAAITAAGSVKSGNTGDSDRLGLHIGALQHLVHGHKGAMTAHKKEISKLTAALKDAEKAQPDLKKTIDPLLANVKKLH